MNRSQAIDRVRKLRALADPARGGTPAEREVAARKAESLVERYGLRAADIAERPAGGASGAPRRWAAGATGAATAWPDFVFNIRTGEASDNVQVHHHHGPGNWKITIKDERIGQPPIGSTERKRRGIHQRKNRSE